MNQTLSIEQELSVNEVMKRHPVTMEIFNRFGIDTCCGANASVTEAARRDGVDIDSLLEAIRDALSPR
jgi:iron-sulfur cluster repair protein YtfE (RIC family)